MGKERAERGDNRRRGRRTKEIRDREGGRKERNGHLKGLAVAV